jgi:hypothetical protein
MTKHELTREIAMARSPLYHRTETDSQSAADAKKQIVSQEIWGGPGRNFHQSHIPKVMAYADCLPLTNDRKTKQRGIEFTTTVKPDQGCHPYQPTWSGEREGVRNEDGYAKIKVQIKFCNQLDEVWVADE